MIRDLARELVRRSGVAYGCYRIFRREARRHKRANALPSGLPSRRISPSEVATAPDELIRRQAAYAGPDAIGFGVFRGEALVCVQWIWHGHRYRQERGYWRLSPDEAKSVQLVTAPTDRGRGLATLLKAHSAMELRRMGFSCVYSRVWWNHAASIRVNEKAGWGQIALVLEIRLPGWSRTLRFVKQRGSEG